MNNFSATSFPRPKHWQDFERKSCILFSCVLNDPLIQLHGRGGQEQDGVDIVARRGGVDGPLVGVQCKGKDHQYGAKITHAELEEEVEKTKKFKPPLDEFTMITTAPDDKSIQEAARLLERSVRRSRRRLSIRVWGWGTIEQHISEHTRAIKAFHPDSTPFSDEQIIQLQTQDKKLDEILTILPIALKQSTTRLIKFETSLRP
jgi:hypothetical protein